MKKRIVSMLLALVMLLGLLPVSAFAEEAPITASITMTAQANGQFLCDPQLDLVVTSNLAEQLGYYDEVDPNTAVSVMDTLVAAHYIIYGEAFAQNPTAYLEASGWISAAFGINSNNWGFNLNGDAPHGEELYNGTHYTAYSAAQAPVVSGDKVEFWLYQDAYWGDYYVWFEDAAGSKVNSVTVAPGELINLFMKGYPIMSNGGAIAELQEQNKEVIGGVTFGMFDDMSRPIGQTDSSGNLMFSLGEPGKYVLTAIAENGVNGYPMVMPILPITVEASNTAPGLVSSSSAAASVEMGQAYTLDLGTVFKDADNDALTYKVSINGAAAVSAAKSYSYTSSAAGTTTLKFTANDGKADSPAYTVTLTTETAKAKLASLLVHTGSSPSDTNVLLKNASDSYTGGITFDPDTLTYNLTVTSDTSNQLRFWALAANSGNKVTLHYGDNQTKDITWTSGSSKYANCLSVGRNELKLVVTGEGRETVTYTLIVDMLPTLTELAATTDKGHAYWNADFAASTKEYTLTVPSDTTTVTLTSLPYSEGVTVTYNGSVSNTVDVTNTNTIQVVAAAGQVTNTYTLNLNRCAAQTVSFNVTPTNAIVKVYDAYGYPVAANADGSFTGMFGTVEHTYAVTKYGYASATGTVPTAGGQVNVSLTKAAQSTLEDVGAAWENFRNSDANMAITDAKTPINIDSTVLKWNKTLGGYPSAQIIVDDALVALCNTGIYKLDLQTGGIIAQGTMVGTSSYGYITPVYAEGMIICALNGGVVQAFNADTLESLWVYQDPLGGQDWVPLVYSDGFVYTGYWNDENVDASFVCLSVTDEDPTKTDEAKAVTWRHVQKGGFYWASPVVVGDTLVIGTDDGTEGTTGNSWLYAFNKYTGKELSKLELTGLGDQRSSIAYDAESKQVFFTTKGGYMCRADLDAATGKLSNLKTLNLEAQSTSTPIVYKGKVYVGSGTRFDKGNIVVADAQTMELLYQVALPGKVQSSMLLSTAYEADTGYIYLYTTYNNNPGGIMMLKVDPTKNTADGAELIEIYDAAGFSEYCICSLICGPDGTLYYKNDSKNILAVGTNEAYLTGISANVGSLSQEFAANKDGYELVVPLGTESVTMDVTANAGCTVTVNGKALSTPVAVQNGTATAELVVTNGTQSRTYTVSIREVDTNAALNALKVSESNTYGQTVKTLNPTFAADNYFYSVLDVGSSRSFENLWPDADSAHATVTVYAVENIKASSYDPQTGIIEVANTSKGYDRYAIYFADATKPMAVRVVVTAENGNTQEYTVVMSKAAAADAGRTLLAQLQQASLDEVNGVQTKIAEIGTDVTLGSEAAIQAARAAYDALTDAQKAQVTNYQALQLAEATLAQLQDQAAADAVAALISAIDKTVTIASEEKIAAARTAYDSLSENAKAKVTNYKALTDAETALEQAKNDKAAADAVIGKIAAIGTVTKDSDTAIKAARDAYDALTAAQKLLVSNYKALTDAESALAALKAEEDTKPTDPGDTEPADPEDTTKPTTPADSSNAKTGDNTNIALYTTLMITSLACMAALVLGFKKKEDKYSR